MIICPLCGSPTGTLETRSEEASADNNNANRRRRQCKNRKCRQRFTTVETIVPDGTSASQLASVPRQALIDALCKMASLVASFQGQQQTLKLVDMHLDPDGIDGEYD